MQYETNSIYYINNINNMEWKCCEKCRCPCKNTDLCLDTPANVNNLLSRKRDRFGSAPDSQRQQSSESTPYQNPNIDDLRALGTRIQERLQNLTIPKEVNGAESISKEATTGSSRGTAQDLSRETTQESSRGTTIDSREDDFTDSEGGQINNYDNFVANELLILRRKLQAVELKVAINEERVNQIISQMPTQRSQDLIDSQISVQQLMQLRAQIIAFIEEKFSDIIPS